MARGKAIALLGGSFNPPHVAHLMVAWWALSTQPVDEVWLLPAFAHPFGKELAPFEDRVRMCELAARALRGVHVCTAERELAGDPLVGKTARTLEACVAEVRAIADFYRKTARSIEPACADLILDSAKHYIVLRRLMHQRGCNGVTVQGPLCIAAGFRADRADDKPLAVFVEELRRAAGEVK